MALLLLADRWTLRSAFPLLHWTWFHTERDSRSWESLLTNERLCYVPLRQKLLGTVELRPLWSVHELSVNTSITWLNLESEEIYMHAVKLWAGSTTRTLCTPYLKPPPTDTLIVKEDIAVSWGLWLVKVIMPKWPSSSLFRMVRLCCRILRLISFASSWWILLLPRNENRTLEHNVLVQEKIELEHNIMDPQSFNPCWEHNIVLDQSSVVVNAAPLILHVLALNYAIDKRLSLPQYHPWKLEKKSSVRLSSFFLRW